MASRLEKLPELLKENIPREKDLQLLKELLVEYQKGGAKAVKTAIVQRIIQIAEGSP